MFAAFWLDPKTQDPNKRVVFCQPFCKKPATAWAILRSAVHENRTGGVLSGADEELKSLVERIDQADQKWPDDQDRMVAQITKMAQQAGLTVVFRQNMEPDGLAAAVDAVRAGLICGNPQIVTEGQQTAIIRIPLTGRPIQLATAIDTADSLGWEATEDCAQKAFGQSRVAITRSRMIASRGFIEIVHEVQAAKPLTKRNSAGYSEEFKLGFDHLDELLDTVLGPTAKKHKFILLIKERNNSIVFFGNKSAQTLRQAVEQYVDHMSDRASSDEPKSSQPDSKEETSFLDEEIAPKLQNCRFWKL